MTNKIMLPYSDIAFLGMAMDINGNKIARFKKNGKAFSVQTNGNMPKTHSLPIGGPFSQDDFLWMRKEIVNYLFKIGE